MKLPSVSHHAHEGNFKMDPFEPNPNPRGGAMGGLSATEVNQERGCGAKGVSQQATNPKLERD